MSKRALKDFLADHPTLVSALLTLILFWSQFETIIADNNRGGHVGP